MITRPLWVDARRRSVRELTDTKVNSIPGTYGNHFRPLQEMQSAVAGVLQVDERLRL